MSHEVDCPKCPKGMVQIEFVGCSPTDKCSEYGWKPVKHAFIDVYIDGERYCINIGDFHDGINERRGLYIIGPHRMTCEQNCVNSCFIWKKTNISES